MKTNVRTPLQRVLSMLLCVAMLLSVPVVPVGATGTEPADDVIPETTAPAETEAETTAPEDGTIEIVGEAPELQLVNTNPTAGPNPNLSAKENIIIHLFNYGSEINLVEGGVLRFTGDTGDDDTTASVTETVFHRTSRDVAPAGELLNGKPEMLSILGSDGYPYVFDSVIDTVEDDEPTNPGSLKYLFDKDSDFVTLGVDTSAKYYDPTVNTQYVSKHFAVKNENGEGTGLFWLDEEGYLVFDSADHRAYFNETTGKFELFDYALRPFYGSENFRGQGHFLPFNNDLRNATQVTGSEMITHTYTYNTTDPKTGETISVTKTSEQAKVILTAETDLNTVHLGKSKKDDGTVSKDFLSLMKNHATRYPEVAKVVKNLWALPEVNQPNVRLSEQADYYYGMTVEFDFFMPKDGKLDGNAMIFDFLGDDDVWVYIDNVLVLNIGGTHNPMTGYIDFSTGKTNQPKATLSAHAAENYEDSTLRAIYENAKDMEGNPVYTAAQIEEMFTGNTFKNYTKHTLKFFYMERGAGSANCRLRFNIPTLPKYSLTVGKELTVEGTGAGSEDAEFVQNSLSYQFRVWKAPEEGSDVLNELFIKPGDTYTIIENGVEKGTGTVDTEGFFSLRAGQQAQFTDMLVKGGGDIYYVVEEVLPKELAGQYGKVQFEVGSSGGGEVKAETGETETFSTFYTGNISAETSQIVTFNNPVVIENLGTLKITKAKTEDAQIDSNTTFDIQVKLGGALLPVGTEYKIGDETHKVKTDGIISLKVGQTAVLAQKILSGTEFEITELLGTGSKFKATYSGTITTDETTTNANATANGVTGAFGMSSTVEVTVTNENVDFSCNIPLYKTALGNTVSTSFGFEAIQVVKNEETGEWVEVEGATADGTTITVAGSEPTAGAIEIAYKSDTVPGDYYYKVYEKAGTDTYIYDETFYIVKIQVKANSQAAIAQILKNGTDAVETLEFVNQKLTKIYVDKKVLGIGTTEKFQFTVKVNGTVVETFDLGNNENKTIAGIPVGATVEVVETAKSGYYAYYQIGTASNTQGDTVSITAPDSTTYIHFTNAKYTADDMVVIDYGLPVEVNVLSNDAFPDGVKVTLVSGKGTYGEAVVTNDNKIRYVLNGLTMDGTDVFTYQVTYAPVNGCETTFEAKLTIIPATTIYYEDSFVTLTTFDAVTNELVPDGWSREVETDEDAVQDEDRPGQSLGGLDANNLYGYDDAYEACATWSGGSVMKTHVWNTVDEDGKATAGVYSTAEFTFKGTGFDVISMTGGNTGTIFITVTSTDPDNTFSKNYMVDTYYGYTYENGEWTVKENATDCLYQIPVMKISGLAYGEYKVTILATYNAFFDHGQYNGTGETDGYDFYLDAIRIYDPANDGAGNETIEDAYVADGEGWPEYYELRNLIIAADTFNALTDNSAAFGGIVFIDGNGENSSIEDYTNFGPNNEVYLAAGQSIAFDLNAGAEFTGEIAKVQIGVKLAQGTPEASIYDAADAANAESKKTIDVNTATDLYYEITELNNKTVVITNTGEGILSITNIKVTFKAAPTRAENPASVFSVSRETAELALASLKLAPEIFVPNNLNAKLNKNEIKVGQKVNVTVTTSRDVAYITVNGQKITTAQLNTKNGSLTWKATVTGEKTGEMEIEIIVYSKDGVAGEPVIKVVKVQAKSNGGNTGKWPGLIKKPYDLPIGDWFN